MGKRKRPLLIAIPLVAALAVGTILALYPEEAKPEVKLREYKVTRGDITVGVDADAMASYKKQDYSFDTEALIEKINFEVGYPVKKDDVLLEISPDSIEEKLSKLNLDYQKAQISYDNAKDAQLLGLLQAEKKREDFLNDTYDEDYDVNIDEAIVNLQEAESNRDQIFAEMKDLEAQLALDPGNAALKTQLNEKKQEYQRANQLVARAELALRKLRATRSDQKEERKTGGEVARTDYDVTVKKLANDLTLAELERNRIAGEIAKLKSLKANPKIVAQRDGIVLAVKGAVGDSATPYKPLVTVGENEIIQVDALISQTEIGKIKVGQKLEARFEAYPDNAIAGEVASISFSPEKSAGSVSYKVVFTLEPTEVPILDGMTGEVTFIIKRKENVLRLSNKAIYFRDGRQYVKLPGAEGVAVETEIKTGFSDGKTTEITEGIGEDQTVVVEG